MNEPKKSLGQHWLNDQASLEAMVDAAGINAQDTVLEIGPGTGTLTRLLVQEAKNVVAVEFDETLARALSNMQIAKNLQIVSGDIRKFDLSQMPEGYKIAANIPYYLTANLIRILTETNNQPAVAALLVQKEVAERLAAGPGKLSQIAAITQLFYDVSLGKVVPAKLFTPPPKVDSQIVILKKKLKPLVADTDHLELIKLIKAGFANPRKTLLNNLSGSMSLSKDIVLGALQASHINQNARAQELAINDWKSLSLMLK